MDTGTYSSFDWLVAVGADTVTDRNSRRQNVRGFRRQVNKTLALVCVRRCGEVEMVVVMIGNIEPEFAR